MQLAPKELSSSQKLFRFVERELEHVRTFTKWQDTPRQLVPWSRWEGPARMLFKILLPSAVHLEERLTVSQSVPEPASRQSDRYTQFGFFVSGRCGPKQQGGPLPHSM